MSKNIVRKIVFAAMIVMVVLAGCAQGNKSYGISKQPGTGRGVISNVDPLNNGLMQVWIFGDNTYVYCTLNKDLQAKVNDVMKVKGDNTVIYTYRDWVDIDIEYTTNDESTGRRISDSCGQFVTGTVKSKLLTVELVNGR